MKGQDMNKISLIACSLLFSSTVFSQKSPQKNIERDTIKAELKEYEIQTNSKSGFGISKLGQVDGSAIYAGKKSEVITMDLILANVAGNSGRQVFAKVAGINVIENDGGGIQLSIGGRGLDPNRVSNFNTRQNGYDISADALGYPESYYTPPMEAVERIEVVRGASSLQYGTQFGGFLNFKFKSGPLNRKVSVASNQTFGSFGFFNSFNSISGTVKSLNYYTFLQHKQGNGWRPNSAYDQYTGFASAQWTIAENWKLQFDFTKMQYRAKQPGGLTDAQFTQDPLQSNRNRNWFAVDWNLAAITLDGKFADNISFNNRTFMLSAGRSSLGYLGTANKQDIPGSERDLMDDIYLNWGNESRFLFRYNLLGKLPSTLLLGNRVYFGSTHRRQGAASNGTDADFSYTQPDSLNGSDYQLPSQNIAFFTENVFQLTSKWAITPGIRWEYIKTEANGYYSQIEKDLAGNVIFQQRTTENKSLPRQLILFGLGTSYKLKPWIEAYANVSQNYRAVNFNDIRVVNPNAKVDPNLKDETGYTADAGLRGEWGKVVYYDFSLFAVHYDNRVGQVLVVDPKTSNLFRYRTNVSSSLNKGLEAFIQFSPTELFFPDSKGQFSLFTNISLVDATYLSSKTSAYSGKNVELAPRIIARNGLSFKYKRFESAFYYSYTSKQYTDATNSEYSSNAVTGIIPAYGIIDLSFKYQRKLWNLQAGINNLGNSIYYTRRADGYPGPGILPSDPRNYYVGVNFKW